jgi:hypothetical protein
VRVYAIDAAGAPVLVESVGEVPAEHPSSLLEETLLARALQ